jgi:23S rRNA pseudouridine2605 synthase
LVRLQKYLAECGIASRRAAERLIEEGRVTVNGTPAEVGCSIDPSRDAVSVDGAAVVRDDKVYVLLNKPANVVSTAKDTHGRKTVLHLLKGVSARVFPVGRLDMDVEGVLLLTNDGELANRLLHPKYGVEKVYRVVVYGKVEDTTARKLERGIALEDGTTAPARVCVLRADERETLLKLTLREGRKREVKRMFAAVRHQVKSLRRVSFANIEARNLRLGEWRYLEPHEVLALRKLAQM